MRNCRLYLKDIFEAIIAAQAFVEGLINWKNLRTLCYNSKSEEADGETWNSEAKKDERHE